MSTPSHVSTVQERKDERRVLLVLDDDVDIAEFVALAAQRIGFQTVIADSADALIHAANEGVTHIVLDLLMPGMDGVEVIRELSRRGCAARLVLMSGFDAQILGIAEDLARKQGLEVLGHLTKPIRLAELEALLDPSAGIETTPRPLSALDKPLTRKDLALALAGDQFFLAYQPQVDIASNRIVGMEALVRWLRPQAGIAYPDLFIGAVESLGMANELTWMVLRKGLKALCDNQQFKSLHLAINISAESLQDLSMPDRFLAVLDEYCVSAARIVLEITETGLVKEIAKAMDILMRFRLKGFQISIDDFGTGYAMMEQLRRVPANEIKIDRCFTRDALKHKSARIVVEKTIEIGHELGMRVVAEGVEEAAQFDFLRDIGCDIAQGYLLGKPEPIEELAKLLRGRAPQ